MKHFHLSVTCLGAKMRLDRFVSKIYPTLPFSLIQKAIRQGDIRLNRKRTKPFVALCEKDSVLLYRSFVPAVTGHTEQSDQELYKKWFPVIQNALLAETKDWWIFNKPAHLPVQGGTGQQISLDVLLKALYGVPAFLVHRLDKETTGLLCVAKHLLAAQILGDLLRHQCMQKTYLAIVEARQDVLALCEQKGAMTSWLMKKKQGRAENIEHYEEEKENTKKAVTNYDVRARCGKYALLELSPVTGRTHQLRVQCAAREIPIVGDRRYGQSATGEKKRKRIPLMLHAWRLVFRYNKKMYVYEAPLSQAFLQLAEKKGLALPKKRHANNPDGKKF